MSPLGNASWCIEGVLICLQRSAHLVPKPSVELLVVLNDPAVLVSDAGTGWTLSLEAGLVITLFLRLWIGSSVLSGTIYAPTALFGNIHGPYYTISTNFYLYLQYFQ